MLQRHLFESAVLFLFLIYSVLYLTPSSYGLVLDLFGYGGEGLLWGTPRPVRSDEWVVWTPYLQSVINNDFSAFNQYSMYQEKFRAFVALPVADWGIIFKPYFWPFFMAGPARAFSVYHGLIIVAFLLGWKLFLDQLFISSSRSNRWLTPLVSLVFFFSGFVQTWWTTLGPLLALFPWFLLAFFQCRKGTWINYVVLWYAATAWLLSHLYPPVVVSCAYFAGFTYLAFNRNIFDHKLRLFLMGITIAVACLVTYIYLQDAIALMSQTVYPGRRVSNGGETHWQMWLSVFIPYITHSDYQDLMNANICEMSALNSLLPMMTLCFLDYQNKLSIDWRKAIFLFIPVVILSLWMLAPVPDLIGKLGLLSLVPGKRMVFALGLGVHLLALYFLCRQGVKLTLIRAGLFFLSVLLGYMVPAFYADVMWNEKSAWELLAPAILIIAIVWFHGFKLTVTNKQAINLLLASALLINLIYFGAFNPGQSAEPIFSLKDRPPVQALYRKQDQSPQQNLFETGYPGAVLTGLKLNSFATVLIEPQLAFFRQLFPGMEETKFNQIFNRYAHIQLYDGVEIKTPRLDVIQIPLAMVNQPHSLNLMPDTGLKDYVDGGFIDEVTLSGDDLNITGWAFFSGGPPLFFSNLDDAVVISMEAIERKDVVAVLGEHNLWFSGFRLRLELDQSQLSRINEQGICLYSMDANYGVRRLGYNNTTSIYSCR